MKNLTPSMRLKLKRDTFFLPEPGRGVYFRNNRISFQMKGNSIDQWVEKLIPMFNGQYTLENLTNGLPSVFRDRVYEITEVLYRNGFVQDVSTDLPHELSEQILQKYASQIEFLQNAIDSGGYRFQTYRQSKVLVIGSGSFLVSLISSLLESGLPNFHLLSTDSVQTNRKRIEDLVRHAKKTDSEAEVREISLKDGRGKHWRKLIKQFDAVLYATHKGNIEELQEVHRISREEKKLFLPAIWLQQSGLVGPVVHPDLEACFESAWRSLHQTVIEPDQPLQNDSSLGGAMLANVMVFELFKMVTGVTEKKRTNQFFLLDMETLEGNWHSFMPHPLVSGSLKAKWVEDLDFRLKQKSSTREPGGLLIYLNQLTSVESGIFHVLEEEDLQQLPLAQCRVQSVDPLSEGPAKLLPSMVYNDLTHNTARKEAGLAGIEAYVSRIGDLRVKDLPLLETGNLSMEELRELVSFGAGETFAEAVCRGLHACLTEELNKRLFDEKIVITPVEVSTVKDEHCHYYLQSLTNMYGEPIIGLGEEVSGFPVVWLGTRGRWYGSAGLSTTLALQKALKNALLSEPHSLAGPSLEESFVVLEDKIPHPFVIRDSEGEEPSQLLNFAIQVLKSKNKQMMLFEVDMEPILNKEILSVYGVVLREEESL